MASTPFDRDTNPSSTRFVILHHIGHGREHWDVMFEHHGTLTTWKVYHDPMRAATAQSAFRIGDHRVAYLEYEGPVSAERGSVTRVRAGTYHALEQNSQLWRVQLTDHPAARTVTLTHIEADRWRIEFS